MKEKKIAVVTGGTRGIGKAAVKLFARNGYKTAFCGRNRKNLEKVERELKNEGLDISAYLCDVSKPDDIIGFVETIKRNFRRIDVLVNNAGVAYYRELVSHKDEEIHETIDTNIRGLILMTKHALPIMSSEGIIINIASGAGKKGYPGLSVYCASKFAVVGFTESLAYEVKNKVVAVCPGSVDTEMYMSFSSRHPSLKPEHIASKIVEIAKNPHKFKSGSCVEVYHVTDALEHLRLKYFGKYKK